MARERRKAVGALGREIDPSHEVNVLMWYTDTEVWDTVAAGPGWSCCGHGNRRGPVADDLANEVTDSSEDPDSYDFSIAHVTGTQYLTEGAVEDDFAAEQQAVWADAYTDIMEWIVDSADEHKIAYVI